MRSQNKWLGCCGLVSLLLCQCTSLHQPIVFAPRYSVGPVESLTPEDLNERAQLEGLKDLNPYQRLRLVELYELELKSLPEKDARAQTVRELLEQMSEGLQPEEEDGPEVTKNPLLPANIDKFLSDPSGIEPESVQVMYKNIYKKWNQNENAEAAKAMQAWMEDTTWQDKVSSDTLFRIQNLRLRIGLNVQDLVHAGEAFEKMKAISPCHRATDDARFTLSLHAYALNQGEKAQALLQEICPAHREESRDRYWATRFLTPLTANPSVGQFERWGPSYYACMLHVLNQRPFQVPIPTDPVPGYLRKAFKVPRSVHKMLLEAEERIKHGVKRDVGSRLRNAAAALEKSPGEEEAQGLLYTAHLFHATGRHRDAFRSYSTLVDWLNGPLMGTGVPFDFVQEMFPRPFAEKIEALSKENKIDPDWIYALMRQESAFNPMAVSSSNALGLLQLLPVTAKRIAKLWKQSRTFKEKDLFQSEVNIKYGAFHLAELNSVVPHLVLIAASYNAGYKRVAVWWELFGKLPLDLFVEMIPVPETRNYVKVVLRNYFYYKALRQNGRVEGNAVLPVLPTYQMHDVRF